MAGSSDRRPQTRREVIRRQAKERKISSIAQAAMIANTTFGSLLGRLKSRRPRKRKT